MWKTIAYVWAVPAHFAASLPSDLLQYIYSIRFFQWVKKKEEPPPLFFPFVISNVSLYKREISDRFGGVVPLTERTRAHRVSQAEQRTWTKAEGFGEQRVHSD